MQLHSACRIFPPLSQEELEELAADIKANGLRNPITTYQGRILDGRNRYKACLLAGVRPRFVKWSGNGSPLQWVVSQNLLRRHLTASQRAAVAYTLLPLLEKEAYGRKRRGRGNSVKNLTELGRASDHAARLTRSNPTYVHQIKAISQQAPELLAEIRNGTITVPDAVELANLTKSKREKVISARKQHPDRKMKRLMREAELATLKASRATSRSTGKAGQEMIHGDCLQVMQERLKKHSVDVVVTSPPWNIGAKYATYRDRRPTDEFLAWMGEVLHEIHRVLKPKGSLFLVVGSSPKQPWNGWKIAERAAKYFILQNEIVWAKSILIDGATHGHFRPLPGNVYVNRCHETVFHFSKTGRVKLDRLAVGVPYAHKANLGRNRARQDAHCAGSVWHIPYDTIQNGKDRGYHPSTFPPELAERCIRLAGVRRNMVVLDPFAGLGNTLRACRTLGVKGIGIEIDRGYVAKAVSSLR